MNKLRLVAMTLFALFAALAIPGCEEENCAEAQENCLSDYLEANGLTGCCGGLVCEESFNGYLVCK